MKKATLVLFISVAIHFVSYAQTLTVSSDGKKITGVLTSSCTRADLDNVVSQLREHNIVVTITKVKFDAGRRLQQIAFDVKTADGNASYQTDDLASMKNGVRIVVDHSPGAKSTLCVGTCTEK